MYVFVTPSGTALLAELSICAGRAKTELSTALANEIRWAAVNCVGTTPAVPLDAEALLLAWRCVLCVRPPKAMVRAGRSASDTTWTERGMMILSSGFFAGGEGTKGSPFATVRSPHALAHYKKGLSVEWLRSHHFTPDEKGPYM